MPDKPNFEEFSDVGADKPVKDVNDSYDKRYGTYKDAIQDTPVEERLPTANMPKAPDPSPFTLGNV